MNIIEKWNSIGLVLRIVVGLVIGAILGLLIPSDGTFACRSSRCSARCS